MNHPIMVKDGSLQSSRLLRGVDGEKVCENKVVVNCLVMSCCMSFVVRPRRYSST